METTKTPIIDIAAGGILYVIPYSLPHLGSTSIIAALIGNQLSILQFTKLRNPKDAKKLGREVQLRSDWERVKLMYMYEICMCKFMQNPTLCKALLATGNCHLVEGNNWGDYFWGSVNGHGENHLGKILMDIRAKLQFEC